jgi:Uma2 family endonuclease
MSLTVPAPRSRARIPVVDFAERPRRGEKRLLFHGMAWKDYLMFGKGAERWAGVRVSYLEGVVEIMFPSYEHERSKSAVSRLLEAYLERQDIEHFTHGSTTIKHELKEAGKEPDESYCFQRQAKHPDLVIEVAITGGGLDTLEIYRRWSIPEVWIWQRDRLRAFVLEEGKYVKRPASRWFPGLDLLWLSECAKVEGNLAAKRKFLSGLEKHRPDRPNA